jgi:hypothetical protein
LRPPPLPDNEIQIDVANRDYHHLSQNAIDRRRIPQHQVTRLSHSSIFLISPRA